MPGDPFDALGDETRRQILRLLSTSALPVGQIAESLPISRPAVSRHLRLLKNANLVEERAEGTRRIYHLKAEGIEAVQEYLLGVWGTAAARFKLLCREHPGEERRVTSPLRISFDVVCPPARAFELWTSRIGTWWPPDHSVSGAPVDVVMEAGVGGRIFERTGDGGEHEWGTITVWEPPHRLGYSWYIGRAASDATDVEVTFIDLGGQTLVEIEHRGWDRMGRDAELWRSRNRIGWETLLPHFSAYAGKERVDDGSWD